MRKEATELRLDDFARDGERRRMPSLIDLAAMIRSHPAPVFFLDTCVLLDVIRAPHRNASETIEAALGLLEAAKADRPRVHLVIAFPTPKEWADHVEETVKECMKAVEIVDAVADAWLLMGQPHLQPLPLTAYDLPQVLLDLSRSLKEACLEVDKDSDALSRAFDRVVASKLPAREGGRGAKDAVILEHAIGLVKILRDAGFDMPCVFVSSNTHDFGSKKTTDLHMDLKGDFRRIGMEYAATLNATISYLFRSFL